MSYQVFVVVFQGIPRDHHAIFVETSLDQTGQIFHVTGIIQMGMAYESKPAKKPEASLSFVSKVFLGTVTIIEYLRLDSVCQQVLPPAKQFDGTLRLNPNVLLRRCQEWTQEAAQALKSEGIIETVTQEAIQTPKSEGVVG